MDLSITGKFIAERRKAKGLTQVKLAERICVSEKTISKWECGNGFPDTTLMLPLCEQLNISANELLSGRLLEESEYKDKAEQNLLELKDKQVKSTKQMLTLEWVVGYLASFTLLICVFAASFAVSNLYWRIGLIVFGFVSFIIGISFAVKIETDAGFYECGHCHHKYIPKYKDVLWSMHSGRTRYLKCPKCEHKSWNKKVVE